MYIGKEFSFTLLDALHSGWNAQEQVSQSTIKNCFDKAKLFESDVRTEPDEIELLEMWEASPHAKQLQDNEQIDLNEFLKADERLKIDYWPTQLI